MFTYAVKSMNVWLYPDDTVEKSDAKCAAVTAAKNGSAGFQLLLNGLTEGEALTASLTGAGGKIYAELFRELAVHVDMNTGVHGFTADWETAKAYATREAPFYVYDALEPIGGDGVKAKATTEALYVSFFADASTEAGRYDYTLHVSSGADGADIPVTVVIGNAVVPEESLYVTNWFSVSNMARDHGLTMWTDAHKAMIERYGYLMRRAHQNVFWLTWDVVGKSGSFEEGYTFDFTNAEWLIERYLDMGFTLIEGSPLYGRDGWDGTTFFINAPDGRFEALSEKGYAYAAAFLTAWRGFLEAHDWYELLVQHVGDEPHNKCAAEYRILSGIIRKFLPAVPIIDAVETFELRGAVDIWVPKNDYYTRNRDALEALRAKGDTIWYYTCCIPGGKYCNRLLDMPLLRSRMLHWGNFKYDIGGFLHWGLNHWQKDQNPFEVTCPHNGPTNYLPAGDTNIVYPLGDKVISSMRLEQMKCGAEDYELLKAMNRDAADKICAKAFRAFDDCDNEADFFDELHDTLVK